LEALVTTPVSLALRPLTLGEILDQAIRLYRNNFANFIGILAIPYIPLIILQTGTSYLMTSSLTDFDPSASTYPTLFGPSYWFGLLGTFAAAILQFVFIQGVATAALTRAIADNYVGNRTDILGAYRALGGSWLRLLLALLLAFLIGIGLVIWLLVPCVGWFTGPGILLFLFAIIVPLIAPVIVLERHGAWDSLRRAWTLSRSRFWWMLGFAFILYLFSQIVITGPTALAGFLLQVVLPAGSNSFSQPLLTTILQSLVTMVFSLLYLPLQLTAITVVYFDLRIRSEGLDLALQTAEPAAPTEANRPVFLPEITPAPQGSIITWAEVGYFALITFGFIALYLLIISVFFLLAMAFSTL
jgi:hypothetical protein